MKRILAIACAVVAVSVLSASSASAQCNMNSGGYGYGVGLGQSGFNCGGGLGGLGLIGNVQSRETLPYFAKHPPVYYNRIVRRPYGISPYAAPAGITPVEMTIPSPSVVKNKFFDGKMAPVSDSKEEAESKTTNDKSAWILNPYVDSIVQR